MLWQACACGCLAYTCTAPAVAAPALRATAYAKHNGCLKADTGCRVRKAAAAALHAYPAAALQAYACKAGQEVPSCKKKPSRRKSDESRSESESESVFELIFFFHAQTPFFCLSQAHIQDTYIARQQRVEAGSDWSLRAQQRAFGSLKQLMTLTKLEV
jgi:hypothetical protein